MWTRRAEHDEPVGRRRSSASGRIVRPALRALLCAALSVGAVAARAQDVPRSTEPTQPQNQPAGGPRFRLGGDHPTLRVGDLEVVFRDRLETSFRTASPVEDGVDADWRRRRIQVEGSYKRL